MALFAPHAAAPLVPEERSEDKEALRSVGPISLPPRLLYHVCITYGRMVLYQDERFRNTQPVDDFLRFFVQGGFLH